MAGKGSTRRKCQVSREEETLRYDLAFGEITLAQFYAGMDDLEACKNPKGICGNCLDGLMAGSGYNGLKVGPDYKITCRHDSTLHHVWHTCRKFREEE